APLAGGVRAGRATGPAGVGRVGAGGAPVSRLERAHPGAGRDPVGRVGERELERLLVEREEGVVAGEGDEISHRRSAPRSSGRRSVLVPSPSILPGTDRRWY